MPFELAAGGIVEIVEHGIHEVLEVQLGPFSISVKQGKRRGHTRSRTHTAY